MKKFVFTLQKSYEIKKTSRKNLLSKREQLQKQLDALRHRKEEMLCSMQKQGEILGAECRAGTKASQVCSYAGYIAGVLSDIKRQDGQINELIKRMEENTEKLMRIINEIKVMEKIRDEQLEEYNKELQKNNDKMLEDFLCGRM